MLLEICANTYQSAKNAQDAGAHRIELCTELVLGGITPSYGLIKQVVTNINLPVYVLIRPRSGDFCYSDSEFKIMKNDIELCKKIGCAGIVSGVLNSNKDIDIERTKILFNSSKPLDFTFHRAFDCVHNPEREFKKLIDIGVKRLLSSGLQATAEKGIKLLKKLHTIGGNKIQIMPGGGINPTNAPLFKKEGFAEIHASAWGFIKHDTNLSEFKKPAEKFSDPKIIKEILKALKHA
ncbi:MAG: copper homeostasis protein CutC [Tenacibaculum sp.]